MMTERERGEVFHAPFQLVTPIMQEKPKNTFRKSWSESISSRTLLHQNHQKKIIMKNQSSSSISILIIANGKVVKSFEANQSNLQRMTEKAHDFAGGLWRPDLEVKVQIVETKEIEIENEDFISEKRAAEIDQAISIMKTYAKSAQAQMDRIDQSDLSGIYELGKAVQAMREAIDQMKSASSNLSLQWDYISK